jgi:hypothetical protein
MPLARSKLAAGDKSGRLELAELFRQYGQSYRKTHRLSTSQQKLLRAIEVCRTQELRGHLKQCDTCGFEHPAYNSCRNRHCPKCQSLAKARWLQKQTAELLPVGYFHLVFTLPHELNRLILAHKKILLALLFNAVSETLLEFGQRRLGGTVGIIAVLHTWDQKLQDHFHLHCLIPAGALSLDHHRWISARKNFLFPSAALSQLFRAKFLDRLQQACENGKSPAADIEIKASRQKSWNVYAKKPFGSPKTVLDYLGRYTHRVALSNERILEIENGEVTLSYRDRRDGNRKKTMALEGQEFIRRFLLYVLPDGFMRIRHFGFWPTEPKNSLCPSAANSSASIPPCARSPIYQPTILCWNSPVSIFLAALVASREP